MDSYYWILIIALLLIFAIPDPEDNEPPVSEQVAQLISNGDLEKEDLLKYELDDFNDIGKVELNLIKKDIYLKHSEERTKELEAIAVKFDSNWYTKPVAYFYRNMQLIVNSVFGFLILAFICIFGMRYWRGY